MRYKIGTKYILKIRKRHVKYKKRHKERAKYTLDYEDPRYVKQVREKKARWLNHVE